MNNSRMILMVLPVAFVAAPASRSANTPTPEQEMTIYLKPQLVVHIDKGRTINFVCMGHGSPTVILTAGLGGWSFNWELVQPALAERNARLRLGPRRRRLQQSEPGDAGYRPHHGRPRTGVAEGRHPRPLCHGRPLARCVRVAAVHRPQPTERRRHGTGGPGHSRPGHPG
jgi:pimeloyl-ACP methyl ester carboxylesterase